MRRKDREITNFNEMIEIIKKCDSCVLALNDEGFPYLVPMNFGMDIEDGQLYLYFHCAKEGRKLELIQKDNRASFEMDCEHKLVLQEEMECSMGYASVIGQGTIEFVVEEDKFDALKILMGQYRSRDFKFDTRMLGVTTVLKMKVLNMTGKRKKVK
ncbi:MAG: pyridoxamine 5'-phosphate oxidase family protein [Firmicutes bacterium]|nr:pyridoxamine 5'-phosphate oxidase family protein [Bacillota bacterium]